MREDLEGVMGLVNWEKYLRDVLEDPKLETLDVMPDERCRLFLCVEAGDLISQ